MPTESPTVLACHLSPREAMLEAEITELRQQRAKLREELALAKRIAGITGSAEHLRFAVNFEGDERQGARAFTNTISIVAMNDVGGEAGEFAEVMKEALERFFGFGTVVKE